MKKIEDYNVSLEELPIYDFVFFDRILKLKCSDLSRYSHENYLFDVLSYTHNGNGAKTIKMTDNAGRKYLEDFNIQLSYAWGPSYVVLVESNKSKVSVKKQYDVFHSEERLEILFQQLITISKILMGIKHHDSLVSDFFNEGLHKA